MYESQHRALNLKTDVSALSHALLVTCTTRWRMQYCSCVLDSVIWPLTSAASILSMDVHVDAEDVIKHHDLFCDLAWQYEMVPLTRQGTWDTLKVANASDATSKFDTSTFSK